MIGWATRALSSTLTVKESCCRGLLRSVGSDVMSWTISTGRDGAQVTELIELVEDGMLVEERLAAVHRGDHVWKRASSA